ncbi:MAG: SpoIIE family protein phosphatase [Anaerolineaceae bacterium]|nr:SpoIIE family protein phosphatase [Anaerolineaceae bacterium]
MMLSDHKSDLGPLPQRKKAKDAFIRGDKSAFLDNLSSTSPDSDLTLILLEEVTESIFIVDENGVILYANPQVEKLFGYQRIELIGEKIEVLLPPEFRQILIKHREKYIQHPVSRPKAERSKLLGRHKAGSNIPIELSLIPFYSGGSPYVLCMISVIAMSSKAADDLRKSEMRFVSLFNAFPLVTFIWQRQGNDFILVNYNNADEPDINATIQKFIGLGIRRIYSQDDQMVAEVERCYQEKISFSREHRNYQLPYSHQVKDLKVTYVFGEPDQVMVMFDDLTVLNNTIDELLQLSSALEQTADAIFITSKKGVIEYVNPAFELMTGFPRAEAVGNNPRIIKSGQMKSDYYDSLWETILQGKVFRTQTINRRRNGEIFIAEQTITPMKNPQGEITHFVSVLKDMTDRIHIQKMEMEHKLAGKIQKQLFPVHIPHLPGYELAGANFATEYTSGDYFDYISMPGNRLGLVVADVCDHGMGPALIMAKTQAHLRSIMHYETDPRNILAKLNQQVHPDLIESMFITMFLGILDPKRHLLEYINAGHTPTYILNQNGIVIHELRNDGLPVGLFEELELQKRLPIPLPPGSLVVLLTDGFHEVFDAQENQFGFQRLLEVIRQHRAAPAGEIILRVREAIQAFSGRVEFDDDQTMIICKRLG